MPKQGAAVIRRGFTIQRDGERWSATWEEEDGLIHVMSAWGSATEPLQRKVRPPDQARRMFEGVLDQRAQQQRRRRAFRRQTAAE